MFGDECFECNGTANSRDPLHPCNGCGKLLHMTCANSITGKNVPLTILVAKGSKWFCENCKQCEACNATEKGPCLGCGECQKNYHFGCLNPVPEKKPKCPWR